MATAAVNLLIEISPVDVSSVHLIKSIYKGEVDSLVINKIAIVQPPLSPHVKSMHFTHCLLPSCDCTIRSLVLEFLWMPSRFQYAFWSLQTWWLYSLPCDIPMACDIGFIVPRGNPNLQVPLVKFHLMWLWTVDLPREGCHCTMEQVLG